MTPTPTTGVESGLVAYWKIEEGSGDILADSSGNGNSLNVQGNTPLWLSEVPSTTQSDTKSLYFDGTNYAQLSDANQNSLFNFNSGFTLEAWTKADGTSNSGIVSKFFPGSTGYMMWLFDSIVVNYVDGPKVWGISNILNSWHHVATVWDGQALSLYIDGVKDSSDQAYTNPPSSAGNSLLIGSYNPASGFNFKGNLDEIKIYNYARLASEINADAGINSPTPTLTPTETPNPTVTPSPTIGLGSVVINEIMWPGSSLSTSDEWIELKNMTSSAINLTNWVVENLGGGTPNITIPTNILPYTIPANGYFLISNNTKENSVINVDPDYQIASVSLDNDGEQLVLKDNFGNIVDTANQAGDWFMGINGSNIVPNKSMSRKTPPGNGASVDNWFTSQVSLNLDPTATESATPKADNI